MAENKTRRNERNLIRTDFEYNYTLDSFKGVDFSSFDGRCDDEHFAYLVNLYKDKEKENGAALESVPGYRKVKKGYLYGGEIYGLYEHAFLIDGKRETYILVHKGEYLYSFSHKRRDIEETLLPIASLSPVDSSGFAFGGDFYLLDGEKILRLKTPFEAVALGDGEGEEAYIPLVEKNGKPYEARNMLSGFFDLERSVEPDALADDWQGLFFRLCTIGSVRGLEVYGMEAGRRVVAVPETVWFDGETLPVLAVAPEAFRGRDIVTAVFSPSVKLIGAGAFSECTSLKRVLIYGTPEIRSEAFGGCSSLESLAVQNVLMTVDETAFTGCDGKMHIFLTDAEQKGWLSRFASNAVFYHDTLFFFCEKGESLFIPCASGNYQTLETIYGGECRALGNFKSYADVAISVQSVNMYFTATAENTAAYVQYYMKSAKAEIPTRHVFVSVCDAFGGMNTYDDVEAFRVLFPSRTERVVSVTLDNKEITTEPNAFGVYYTSEYQSGILSGVRVLLPRKRSAAHQISVRCYSQKRSDGADEFYKMNPQYKGTPYEAIRSCRFAAVFDGSVFLGGSPLLPDTVFHSVTPKREGDALSFAPSAYLTLRDTAGALSAFAVHPLYLALIKDRSLYGVTRGADKDSLHERYEINGWCLSPKFSGGSFTYEDEPLYLTERGVMALTPGKAWEEGRIENRSHYIDGKLRTLSLDGAVFAEWNGYLVLLVDGKIFLGDASIAEKKNGALAYEWYYLEDIGHYDGDLPVYHHLSHLPTVNGERLDSLTLDGTPLLILGREDKVLGEVFSGFADGSDLTVHYTVGEDGAYYLVDSYGEREGGFFSPATKLLSAEGCLYFASEDGYLFLFNSDKRGKTALVNDTLFSVAPDEIHASFYSFDGHSYSSVLVTANEDMGVPHLAKRTALRSLVVRAKSMPHAAFDLAVRYDGKAWERVGTVVANESYLLDVDRLVLSSDERTSEVLAESGSRWLSKQVKISADVFESPIGFDALAYRYKMAGRVRAKTKKIQ